MKKPCRIALMVIGGLIAAAALAFLVGLLVQALWNAVMPDVFGLPTVSYWQAVGLLVLGHLLFGGGVRGHSNRGRRRDRTCRPGKAMEPAPIPESSPETV